MPSQTYSRTNAGKAGGGSDSGDGGGGSDCGGSGSDGSGRGDVEGGGGGDKIKVFIEDPSPVTWCEEPCSCCRHVDLEYAVANLGEYVVGGGLAATVAA